MQEYILNQDGAVVKVLHSKVYYVTTHPTKAHAVIFITADGVFEKYMSLAKVEEMSLGKLFRCHRKFLVNLSKVIGLKYETKTILFMDERVSDIICSRRYFKTLKERWLNTKGDER